MLKHNKLYFYFLLFICPNLWGDTIGFNVEKINDHWDNHWTQHEKNMYYIQLSFQVLDIGTTIYATQKLDAEEINPIFGKKPNIYKLLGIKLIGNGIIFTLLNDHYEKDQRLDVLYLINLLMGGVIANNFWVIYQSNPVNNFQPMFGIRFKF